MPFRKENRHLTIPLAVVIAALFVVGIGVQAYVAQQDDRDRDRADRAYADCLTDFAAELVRTIETRTDAGARLERAQAELERAQERKSRALDRLLIVTALATDEPPRATDEEFQAALQARIAQQARYDDVAARVARIRGEVAAVRDENEYVSPRVVCER